jgi:hypothetical protein
MCVSVFLFMLNGVALPKVGYYGEWCFLMWFERHTNFEKPLGSSDLAYSW